MKLKLKDFAKRLGKKYILFILTIFSVLLFVLLYQNVSQKDIDIQKGQLASETIRANKTIENKQETEEKRKLAEQTITPEYTYDDSKEATQIQRFKQLFKLISDVKSEKTSDTKKAKDKEKAKQKSVEDQIASLKKKFENLDQDTISFYQNFPDEFYTTLFQMNDQDLKEVEDHALSLIQKYMQKKIRNSALTKERALANNEVQYLGLNANQEKLLHYMLNQGIVVNEATNEKRTKQLRQAARENVAPVMIYQGEIIVRENEQIDDKAMQKLELLGMTNRNNFSVFPLVALAMAIILQFGMLLYVLYQTDGRRQRLRCVNFYVLMMLISVLIVKFLHVFQTDSFNYLPLLFPAAFTPLVLTLFINRRVGILSAIFQVIFSLFIFYDLVGTSNLLLMICNYLFAGMIATLIRQERIGQQIRSASLWLLLFPFICSLILNIYQGIPVTDSQFLGAVICGIASNLLTFLLSIGLHPYIELLLNDDSMLVLNELSNPNHPLLKKLLEEAPGTYHHSMMVASLSANAVAEIGGRSLLTRVACYYHDIGKIKHANFFVENLPAGAENPHNFLLPEDSKEIIFGHVTEGAKILEKENMPQMVIDICRQHHGTTLMRYFFVKAQERDPEVREEEYRYPGPKPQTREAAVVSIADSAEAAVRAMENPTNEKIKKFVADLVTSRLEDGQLDECDLTMSELRKVEKSIVNGLCSSFHSRIKYPKMKAEAEKMIKLQEEGSE